MFDLHLGLYSCGCFGFQAGEFFTSAHRSATAQQSEIETEQVGEDLLEAPLLQEEKSVDPTKQVKLGFLTGLVPREKSMVFERILFRATRGNIFIRQSVIEESVVDPNSGEKVSCLCSTPRHITCGLFLL